VRHRVEEIKRRVAGGPPEDVAAISFLLPQGGRDEGLVDHLGRPSGGLAAGDAALNAMDPPGSGSPMARSVEVYGAGGRDRHLIGSQRGAATAGCV
jgi:hypothetical protein